MPAEKGEKCGVCAKRQHEGAYICHSCHAEREVLDDYSFIGRLKGAVRGCGLVCLILWGIYLFYFHKTYSSGFILICLGVASLGLIAGWHLGSQKIVWIKIRRDRSLEIY